MKIHEATLRYRVISDGVPPMLDTPEKVAEYMEGALEDPTVEYFHVIMLNRKNRALGRVMISKGTATCALVHPREVFKPVIVAGATAFIVTHNHPSGDPAPSQADMRATRQLREAAGIFQIEFIDHIILGDKEMDPGNYGYYSFAESGLL